MPCIRLRPFILLHRAHCAQCYYQVYHLRPPGFNRHTQSFRQQAPPTCHALSSPTSRLCRPKGTLQRDTPKEGHVATDQEIQARSWRDLQLPSPTGREHHVAALPPFCGDCQFAVPKSVPFDSGPANLPHLGGSGCATSMLETAKDQHSVGPFRGDAFTGVTSSSACRARARLRAADVRAAWRRRLAFPHCAAPGSRCQFLPFLAEGGVHRTGSARL